MKITRIELNESEKSELFKELIKRFNEEDKPQFIESDERLITWESELELYTEYSEPSKYNHETPDHLDSEITYRSVSNFRITFFHEGEEVEVSDWNIEDKIRRYYEK